jgi:hypothetical protein
MLIGRITMPDDTRSYTAWENDLIYANDATYDPNEKCAWSDGKNVCGHKRQEQEHERGLKVCRDTGHSRVKEGQAGYAAGCGCREFTRQGDHTNK